MAGHGTRARFAVQADARAGSALDAVRIGALAAVTDEQHLDAGPAAGQHVPAAVRASAWSRRGFA
jgi:hypothetical protein